MTLRIEVRFYDSQNQLLSELIKPYRYAISFRSPKGAEHLEIRLFEAIET